MASIEELYTSFKFQHFSFKQSNQGMKVSRRGQVYQDRIRSRPFSEVKGIIKGLIKHPLHLPGQYQVQQLLKPCQDIKKTRFLKFDSKIFTTLFNNSYNYQDMHF